MGKTDHPTLQEMMLYYTHRLPKHWNFEMIEIPEVKNTKNLTPELLKKEEAKLFNAYLETSDWIVLLDEKGKEYTSREFAKKIHSWQNNSLKKISFLIGGAYGFAEEIYAKSHEKISLSRMTFTHQMIRLFFVEQLYRADQILQGKPYHND